MTHDELSEYINKFQPNQRETIFKQILDSDLLAKAFETSEGRAVLNNAVDLIASNVTQIIRYCAESPPKDAVLSIYPHATEINTTYKLMQDWARILIEGSEHKFKAEN